MPLNRLTYNPWPQGRDVTTWRFCAQELLAMVTWYSKTATAPFIRQGPLMSAIDATAATLGATSWQPSLQRAVGVCSAHESLSGAQHALVSQMVETEIGELQANSASSFHMPPLIASSEELSITEYAATFKQELARLQALTLYLIIGLYSLNARSFAEKYEQTLASWTNALLVRVQTMQIHSDDTMFRLNLVQQVLIEDAYRTILISFLTRGVYYALTFQTCPVLGEMSLVPMYVPGNDSGASLLSGAGQSRQKISYLDFVQKDIPDIYWSDRFYLLPLVACKGLKVLSREHYYLNTVLTTYPI
jgi:hypothetical protein